MSKWIDWGGDKECPIPNVRAGDYRLKFTDSYELTPVILDAKDWLWGRNGIVTEGNIVAYKTL